VWRHSKNVGWRSIVVIISCWSAAETTLLVAFSCNLTLTVNTITSQVRQHKHYVTWLHQTLSLAATFLPHEYFPTRLKAYNYCMQELQRVARNNCTWKWNHGINRPFARTRTRWRQWRRSHDVHTARVSARLHRTQCERSLMHLSFRSLTLPTAWNYLFLQDNCSEIHFCAAASLSINHFHESARLTTRHSAAVRFYFGKISIFATQLRQINFNFTNNSSYNSSYVTR